MFKKSWWFAWFLVALFFALSIWARVWYGRMLGGQEAHNFIIDIWVAGIFLMVPTVVIGPLAGVVPWRGQPYWRRVLNRLPFITAGIALLVLAIASIEFWYSPLAGMEWMQGADFEKLGPEPGTDCSAIHDGVFQNEALRIERSGTKQYQWEPLGMESDLNVEWTSDCEYTLTTDGSEMTMHVKVLKVDSAGYECAYMYAEQDRVVHRSRFERVR